MASAMKCDSCGTYFDADKGFAVAVMMSHRHGMPFNEAPQYQHGCSSKCAGTLAANTSKVREQQMKDDEAHKAKVEKEAEAQRARDAADLKVALEAARTTRIRELAATAVAAANPIPE